MAEAEARASAAVDETTVAEFLGEESARLLLVARDTANEVRSRAEEYANVTVRGADTYAKNKTERSRRVPRPRHPRGGPGGGTDPREARERGGEDEGRRRGRQSG